MIIRIAEMRNVSRILQLDTSYLGLTTITTRKQTPTVVICPEVVSE
jgi:hypothetical protein